MKKTHYTTVRGSKLALTAKLWRGIKIVAEQRFDGSGSLFESSWNKYRDLLKHSIDNPENIDDVMGWLDSIAAEKVNNSKSSFYING